MKKNILANTLFTFYKASFIVFLVAPFIAFSQETKTHDLAYWQTTDKMKNRAEKGEKVLMIIVKIKNESKKDFEKWIDEIFYPAEYRSKDPMKIAQNKTARWMIPVRQNKDSTWTYAWIMDPYIPNTNYDISDFFTVQYGKELGEKYWQMYLSYLAETPMQIAFFQTDK